MTSIDSLPTEILQIIFNQCIHQTAISAVCRRWADAALPELLQWTCLEVSRGIPRLFSHRCSRLDLIGKRLLQKTNRPYTCLGIEWRRQETDRNMQMLSDLLDVCEERFTVQRLFLTVPCNGSLVQFIEKRQDWLKSIVELDVRLEPPALMDDATVVQEVLLPHLKELTWIENRLDQRPRQRHPERRHEGHIGYTFALNAPELNQLKVGFDVSLTRDFLGIFYLIQNGCNLFMPTLKLTTYPKLEHLTIKQLSIINQSRIDNSERCLQNLTVLTFDDCHSDVIIGICEKCSNLKELTINDPLNDESMSLQISPTLSAKLEHLTIRRIERTFDLNGEAVFSKLQSITLNELFLDNVLLIAPQLTMCNILWTNHSALSMPHNDQIRTLKVQLEDWIVDAVPPPPNVTELVLHLRFEHEHRYIYVYLEYFPNLRELSVFERTSYLLPLDCAFFQHLPHLQQFSAYNVTISLVDVQKFVRLKSLMLSNCSLHVEPNDDQASLTALEYVRVYNVRICGIQDDNFPIQVNERQPPIEIVGVFESGGLNFFSSKYFKEPLF